MTLRLDDDDDEAEHELMGKLERRVAADLHGAMREVWDDSGIEAMADRADDLMQDASPLYAVTDRVGESGNARDALRRALHDGASLGASVAFETLSKIGLGFDYTLVNQRAAEWAAQRAGILIRDINQTTLTGMRNAINEWITNGDPFERLVQELIPIVVGRERAKLIAATEVTTAFAQGTHMSFKESGVVQAMAWRTASDERVCPICGNLDGQIVGIDDDFSHLLPDDIKLKLKGPFKLPPAHVRCRCWITPVIVDIKPQGDV